ncbi:hypothetical protein HS121_17475 [bacterium]|nr:hypothetical protein [bacterium]
MEGTLGGLFGAIFLAGCAWLVGAIPASATPLVVLAAFIGANAESVLAAMIQYEFTWRNEILNLANTAIGGLVALGVAMQTQPPCKKYVLRESPTKRRSVFSLFSAHVRKPSKWRQWFAPFVPHPASNPGVCDCTASGNARPGS